MKLTAYLRVSTTEQAENGQGIDIQRQAIREWAKNQGHEIVHWFADEGISGKNGIEDRPGLEDSLASIRYNGSEGLVTASLDRLARTLTVQEGTLAAVWKAGGTVYTVDGGEVPQDDIEDPYRTAMRQMLGVMAQLEAGMIRRRLHKGRMARAQEPNAFIGGQVRYGYMPADAPDGKGSVLVEDPHEQRVIAVMKAKRAEGFTYEQIADYLNNVLKVPGKNGGLWRKRTTYNVLTREEQDDTPD